MTSISLYVSDFQEFLSCISAIWFLWFLVPLDMNERTPRGNEKTNDYRPISSSDKISTTMMRIRISRRAELVDDGTKDESFQPFIQLFITFRRWKEIGWKYGKRGKYTEKLVLRQLRSRSAHVSREWKHVFTWSDERVSNGSWQIRCRAPWWIQLVAKMQRRAAKDWQEEEKVCQPFPPRRDDPHRVHPRDGWGDKKIIHQRVSTFFYPFISQSLFFLERSGK